MPVLYDDDLWRRGRLVTAALFVIRNRWPSGAMSRWRPGTAGLKKPGVSKSLLGGSAANVELLVGETRIEAQIDS
jgi:hypothetical protein